MRVTRMTGHVTLVYVLLQTDPPGHPSRLISILHRPHALIGFSFHLYLSILHPLPIARLTTMAGPARPSNLPSTRRTGLRQPSRRAGSTASSATTERGVSPAIPPVPPVPAIPPVPPVPARLISNATTRTSKSTPDRNQTGKRKERDYEREINEDTSIHVVVRCRGRNDREIKENSGVVLSTEGVSGKNVDLSMGPNALSNKVYSFDKVFSPAADQITVYDEVVQPIVNEVSQVTMRSAGSLC